MRLPFPLQDGERVLLVCRRHWFFLYPRLALLILTGVAPVIALIAGLVAFDAFEGNVRNATLAGSAVWLLLWGLRAYLFKYRYDNDIWVVTNQRIIDCVRTLPWNLRMTSADLIDIVDTSVNRSGILRTLFDYGDIECETAGERHNLSLAAIPRPRETHAIIDRERDRERRATYGQQTPAHGPLPPAAH